ncbi:GON-4-like protein [Ptychodera flava]|uniref:GON-4-like protein n=1 Tax=Ptychodera flava TaxID=63121 RepID=UPI00396A5690
MPTMSASNEARTDSHEEKEKTRERDKNTSKDGKDTGCGVAPDNSPRETDAKNKQQKRPLSELKSPKKAWLAKMTENTAAGSDEPSIEKSESVKNAGECTGKVSSVSDQTEISKTVSADSNAVAAGCSHEKGVEIVVHEEGRAVKEKQNEGKTTTETAPIADPGSCARVSDNIEPNSEHLQTVTDPAKNENSQTETLNPGNVGRSESATSPEQCDTRDEGDVLPMEPGSQETLAIINEVLEEARIRKKKKKKAGKSKAKKRLRLDDSENVELPATDALETETVTKDTSLGEGKGEDSAVAVRGDSDVEMIAVPVDEEKAKESKSPKRTLNRDGENAESPKAKRACSAKNGDTPKDLQIDEDIEKQLEANADKNNLSVYNVKTILHHVITNEHVLAMVRNTMRDMDHMTGDEEPATYEPKMTRSKLKEVTEKGGSLPLPWPISPLKQTASKKPLQFKDLDFSDSDSTSDEDYKPEEDDEREESDYESIASSQPSEFGSPAPRTPLTPRSVMTDQETDTPTKVTVETEEEGDDAAEATKTEEGDKKDDEKSEEKKDEEEEEEDASNKQERHVKAAVVPMGPPPPPPKPAKSPVKDAQTQVQSGDTNASGSMSGLTQEEQDLIAYRTRSKLPLKDTPLDMIEANFVAPDITTDMYEFNCDDHEWKSWLTSLLKEEIDSNDAVDDEQNDPEYNFLSEEEPEDLEDFRNDRAVQITKKEVNELLDELLETYGSGDFYDNNLIDDVLEEEQSFNVPPAMTFEEPLSSLLSQQKETAEMQLKEHNERRRRRDASLLVNRTVRRDGGQQSVPTITLHEREQLQQQLQQHIQLLCQIYVLCQGQSTLEKEATQCRVYVNEIDMFAKRNETTLNELLGCNQYRLKSAFNVCNLQEGLQVINMSKQRADVNTSKHRDSKSSLPPMTEWAQEIIATKSVFMYHELLPVCGATKTSATKLVFTEAEDNLVALGLDQFKKSDDWAKLISQHMLPTKTASQIKVHVKNLSATRTKDNIIKLYKRHQTLPTMPVFIESVQDGCQVPPTFLPGNRKPEWLKEYEKLQEYKRISEAEKLKQTQSKQKESKDFEEARQNYGEIIQRGSMPRNQDGKVPVNTRGRKPDSVYKNAAEIIDPLHKLSTPVIKPILPKGVPPPVPITRADFKVKTPPKSRLKKTAMKQSQIVPAMPMVQHVQGTFTGMMSGSVPTIIAVQQPLVSGGSGGTAIQPLVSSGISSGGTAIQPLVSSGISSGGTAIQPLVASGSGGTAIQPLVSSGISNTSGGTAIQPLVTGGMGIGGTTIQPLVSSGISSGGTAIQPLVASGSGGTTIQPLVSGGISSGGTATQPLVSSGISSGGTAIQPMVASGNGGTAIQPLVSSGISSGGTAIQQLVSGDTGNSGTTVQPLMSGGSTSSGAVMQPSLLPVNVTVVQKPHQQEVPAKSTPMPATVTTLPSLDGALTSSLPQTMSPIKLSATMPSSPALPITERSQLPSQITQDRNNKAIPSTAVLSPSLQISKTSSSVVSPKGQQITSMPVGIGLNSPSTQITTEFTQSTDVSQGITTTSTRQGSDSLKASRDTPCKNEANCGTSSAVGFAERGKTGQGCQDGSTNKNMVSLNIQDQSKVATDRNDTENDLVDAGKQEFQTLEDNDKYASENEEESNHDEVAMATNYNDGSCECPEDDVGDMNDDGILMDKENADDNTDSNPCHEEDSASSMKPKVTGSIRSKRMKTKFRKDLESTIMLLQPDLIDSDGGEKDNAIAQAFLKRVKHVLAEQPEKYKAFLEALCEFGENKTKITDLFGKLEVILNGFPDLLEEFSCFMTAEQAMECGLFMSHLEFIKARTFLRELEVYFQKQPNHYQKILKVFKQWGNSESKDYKALQSSVLPLLRGQPHLEQEFMQLIPTARPPDSHMTDFEEINWEDKDDYEHDGFEEIELPDSDEEKLNTKTKQQMMKKSGGKFDPWKLPNMEMHGTRECQCHCHQSSNDPRVQRKARHCVLCNPALQLSRAELAKTVLQARSMNVPEGGKRKQAKKILHHRIGDEIIEEDTDDQFQSMTETCVNNLSEMCDNLAEILNENSGNGTLQHLLSADSEDNSQSSENDSDSGNESSNTSNEAGSFQRESLTTILSSGVDRSATNSPIEYSSTVAEDGEVEQKSNRIVLKISMNSSRSNTPTMEMPDGSASCDKSAQSSDNTDDGSGTSTDVDAIQKSEQKQDSFSADTVKETESTATIEHIDNSDSKDISSDSEPRPSDLSETVVESQNPGGSEGSANQSSQDILNAQNVSKGEDGKVTVTWTRDDDRILLQLCQTSGPSQETFAKVSGELGGRKTIAQTEERFNILMKLFQEANT